jgi:flagellar assembly factor FliW
MVLETVHFGQLEVDATELVRFPGGIAPFAGLHRFVLLSREDETPFCWLQSADEPALAFVCAPVAAICPEQERLVRQDPALTEAERQRADVLAVVVLAEDPLRVTANMLAPLVVDFARREGRQVIRDGALALCRVAVEG